MEFFWVKHPKVEKPAQVPESALAHWEGRGWERTEPPAPDTEPEPTGDATTEQSPEPVQPDPAKTSRAQRRPATEE